MIENILSIDVEEIYHTEYARHLKEKVCNHRTPENTRTVLDFLSDSGITATFFIVGDIAEKYSGIINEIKQDGHEVGFHSWQHLPLWESNAESFRKEAVGFKKIHPDCRGYRAPSFSLRDDTKWALEILRKNGFLYDSSIFPAWTPLYGIPNAPLYPYKPSLTDVSKEDEVGFGIYEFPLAIYRILGLRIPIAGGFWLCFWNPTLIKNGIRSLNKKGIPATLFAHTREFDSETPRLKLAPYRSFVTYYNPKKLKEFY